MSVQLLTEEQSIVRADQVVRMDDFNLGIYQPMFQENATIVDDLKEEMKNREAFLKANVHFHTPEDRQECYEKLKRLPMTFVFSETSTIEMMAEGVSKASGLEMLSKCRLFHLLAFSTEITDNLKEMMSMMLGKRCVGIFHPKIARSAFAPTSWVFLLGDTTMSTLEATVSMLETLPEEDLLAISGIVQRFIVKNSSPYKPMTKQETLDKLATSRKHAEEGNVIDARVAAEDIRRKYGLG